MHPHLSTVTTAEVFMAATGGRTAHTCPEGEEETLCGKESQAGWYQENASAWLPPVHLTKGLLVGTAWLPLEHVGGAVRTKAQRWDTG